jgi:hypothetical protein
MRTVSAARNSEAGHIVYNRSLIEFARHYGYLPKNMQAIPPRLRIPLIVNGHSGRS